MRSAPRFGRAARRSRSGPPSRTPGAGCPARARSRRSGSAKRSGSRLAAPMTAMTAVALGDRRSSPSTRARPGRCGPSAGWGSRSGAAPRPRGHQEAGSARRRASWSGLRRSVSSPLPIRLVVVSWPPTMVTMTLATTSDSLRRSPSTSAVARALIKPSVGWLASLRDRLVEVGAHLLHALQGLADSTGVVLEVAQHLGEVLGPPLEQVVVRGGHPEHLGGHDGRQRVGERGHHVEAVAADQVVDEGAAAMLGCARAAPPRAGG